MIPFAVRRRRPSAPLLLAIASVAAVIAVGCGGGEPPGVAEARPAGAEPTPTINLAREVARGKRLIEKHGCLDCHTTDGRDQIGPTWTALYGSSVRLAGGQVVVADEGYLWASVRDPNAQIVEGYLPDIMLPLRPTDAEITSMVEYIKSLE